MNNKHSYYFQIIWKYIHTHRTCGMERVIRMWPRPRRWPPDFCLWSLGNCQTYWYRKFKLYSTDTWDKNVFGITLKVCGKWNICFDILILDLSNFQITWCKIKRNYKPIPKIKLFNVIFLWLSRIEISAGNWRQPLRIYVRVQVNLFWAKRNICNSESFKNFWSMIV